MRLSLGSVLLALSVSQSLAVDCTLSPIDIRGGDEPATIYDAATTLPAIYYHANLDVNTDGTARSYHPDDPWAESLAINNLGNAFTSGWDAKGKFDCDVAKSACLDRFMAAYEIAHAAKFDPDAGAGVRTTDIIPWKKDEALGWNVPCLIEDGPFKGYFVSQTAWPLHNGDACNIANYIDSYTTNGNVIPDNAVWKSGGIRTDGYDLVVVRDRHSGRIAYAINGDTGPWDNLGEGTIALVSELNHHKPTGKETSSKLKDMVLGDVDYLIFLNVDIRKEMKKATGSTDFSQADIDRIGKAAFEKWGGDADASELLAACYEQSQ